MDQEEAHCRFSDEAVHTLLTFGLCNITTYLYKTVGRVGLRTGKIPSLEEHVVRCIVYLDL